MDIYLSGGAVKYLIEATDGQNGEISLKKTGSLNSFDLDNGNNINVTEAFFKAKDTFLSSNGNSNSSSSSGRIVLVGETIAEGNLELETVKDVTIRAKKTAVKGNLAVNAENGYGVEITSEGGAVSTGSTEITAPSLFVMLQAQNDITLLGGTLQTQNDIVKYSDGGEMGTDNGNRRDI